MHIFPKEFSEKIIHVHAIFSVLFRGILQISHLDWIFLFYFQRCILMSPLTQPAFTCSKLTTETLEQCVKYLQSKQRYQNDADGIFNANWTYSTPSFRVYLVNFEQVNNGWGGFLVLARLIWAVVAKFTSPCQQTCIKNLLVT